MFLGVENCPRRNLDKSLKQTLLNSYILNILAERVLLWIHFFFLIHRESFYIYSFGGRFYPKCLARWRSVQSILLVAQSRDKGLAFILNKLQSTKVLPTSACHSLIRPDWSSFTSYLHLSEDEKRTGPFSHISLISEGAFVWTTGDRECLHSSAGLMGLPLSFPLSCSSREG